MRSTVGRRVLIAAPLAVLASCLAAGSAAGATPRYAFSSDAYGSTATVGSIAHSGRTSHIDNCTLKLFRTTDHAAALNLGPLGMVGAVTTEIQGASHNGTESSTSTSKTASTQLLGGLVKADAITTQSSATHDRSGFHLHGSTTIAGLRINGVPVTAHPKVNQKVSIPNVATVVLNAQRTSNGYGLHRIEVTGIQVTLLKGNQRGLPTGTVVVGHTDAGVHTPQHARPYGSAFATQLNVANTVTSGPTAPITLPCGGSDGQTRVNSTAAVRIGDAASISALSSSAKSTDDSRATTAVTGAKAAHVRLLGGVVSVDTVTARATVTRSNGKLSRSSAGTSVGGLRINGHPVNVGAKANTKIDIAGVGTLWLNRSTPSGTQLQVYGLQLQVLTARNGLKAGAEIDVAGARAGVHTD